ncbi:MAG: tRNA (adenosine(37)-N6)-threonylcarbamoyltransferase complex ATPase subunit type 1 TsaE [Neisseriaceae bacterium]
MKLKIKSLEETQILGKQISKLISPKFTIAFNGELGAGKTTLISIILKNIGVIGNIKSPTYTLVEEYHVDDKNIYHFDLYRFNDPYEWVDSGFNEYFTSDSICFIEWASKADSLIPDIDWKLNITIVEDERFIEITALTDKGRECQERLMILGASLLS